MKPLKKLSLLLLCLCLILPTLSFAAKADNNNTEDDGIPTVVSLGDSYASGEGVPPFYGQDAPLEEKVKNERWLGHQSQKAAAGQITFEGMKGTMSDYLGTKWFFSASSGSTTDHIKRSSAAGSQQLKEYNRNGLKGSYNMPGQLDVFYENPNLDRNKVDYVTLSIGGNDVEFDKIIAAAAGKPNNTDLFDMIADKIDHLDDPGGTMEKLRNTYTEISKAAPNATIIVTGYPELLDSGSYYFEEYEVQAVNQGAEIFNFKIRKLINELQKKGMKIEFVDVSKAFHGHGAGASDSYLNDVYIFAQDQDLDEAKYGSPYSVHPNEKGIKAYTKCIQEKIDELEARKKLEKEGRDLSSERNVVLVLDNSGSMEGEPIRETKRAAKEFIDNLLEKDASIGIVTFESNAKLRSDFSKDASKLKGIIDGIGPQGRTNTEAGLRTAATLLGGIKTGKRIIVLMSDGLTNEGLKGEALMAYIESLRDEGIYFYTMGFFESLSGTDLNKGQQTMESIANPGGHYEVEDASQLSGFFNDVADQIKGQNYAYARIACPVDVEVTYKGETLSSVTGQTRTSFGTLTFEEGEGTSDGTDNRTKILRLKEDGTKYEIVIRGNGTGTMNYTAGYMDSNGEYTDLREIRNVPITKQTKIVANAERNSPTTLQVDKDGDGKVDETLKAGEPARPWLKYILYGAVAIVVLALLKKIFGRSKPKPKTQAAAAVSNRPQTAPRTEEPVTSLPRMNFCNKCGMKLGPEDKFCPQCGKKL